MRWESASNPSYEECIGVLLAQLNEQAPTFEAEAPLRIQDGYCVREEGAVGFIRVASLGSTSAYVNAIRWDFVGG